MSNPTKNECTELVVDVTSGLLVDQVIRLSPNRDARPVDTSLQLVVVHGISLPPGEFGGHHIEQLFLNQLRVDEHPYFKTVEGLKVSAHLLIRRDGSVIQFVPFHERAWHAGISQWRGRAACNDFSVGIELEGSDEVGYTDAQYLTLNQSLMALRRAYPSLLSADVVGHSDVAPGRKTDPGPHFDWSKVT